MSSRFSPKTD